MRSGGLKRDTRGREAQLQRVKAEAQEPYLCEAGAETKKGRHQVQDVEKSTEQDECREETEAEGQR
jgi:hypothetical protein